MSMDSIEKPCCSKNSRFKNIAVHILQVCVEFERRSRVDDNLYGRCTGESFVVRVLESDVFDHHKVKRRRGHTWESLTNLVCLGLGSGRGKDGVATVEENAEDVRADKSARS